MITIKRVFFKDINLKQIIEQFPDCVTNGAKLKAILLDTYPEISKAIVNTLVIMANSGIAKEIQDSENITDLDKSRWQKKLEDDYGLSDRIILNSIEILEQSVIDNDISSNFEIDNDILVDINGCLFLKTQNTTYLLRYIGNDTTLILPEKYCGNNYQIYKGAFFECNQLESITIPNGIINIGYYAFEGCNNLKYKEYETGLYLGNNQNPYLALIQAKDKSITTCSINRETKIISGSAFAVWCSS